jgi:hypothetical protein
LTDVVAALVQNATKNKKAFVTARRAARQTFAAAALPPSPFFRRQALKEHIGRPQWLRCPEYVMSAVAGPPLPSTRMINTRHGPVAIHERTPMQRTSLQPPPLLLLHANPGDSRDYDAVAPALSQNFRTIAVDWPGYGSSPSSHPEQLTAMAFADCLEDLISALQVSAPQRSCLKSLPYITPLAAA